MERPGSWIWSHDIQDGQLAGLGPPGWSLVSLSSYGGWYRRRFAAVVHKGPAVGRIAMLDLPAHGIGERLRHARARPVAVTAGPEPGALLSVLVESGPGPESRIAADLTEDGLRALAAGPGGITGLTTYTVRGGARRFAAVHDEAAGPSLVFTGVTERSLRRELRRFSATVTRLRAYVQDGEPLLAAVAGPAAGGFSAWYAGLDADGVARKLGLHRAYPADLGAVRDDDAVRYTVVMRR
jgi:hypothetical protein